MASGAAPTLQLTDYLEKLPGTTFRKLYQQPSTALAIFRRMLPTLAQMLVMRILYRPVPVLLSDVDSWVKPESKKYKDQALSTLKGLHMVQISIPTKERPQEMQLTTNFRNSLQAALEGRGSHASFGVLSALPVPPEIDIPFLDKYARRKWEDILHYVVNSVARLSSAGAGDGSGGPKASVKELLLAGRLIERRQGHSGVFITQGGFTFLLQEINTQVWTLLLLWLEAADAAGQQAAGMESVDMMTFLFMLASLDLGRAYDTNALTESRRNMIPSLVDFGLIYIPNHKPQQYFPTRLATTLTSSASSLRSVSEGMAAATAAARSRGGSVTATGTGSSMGSDHHKGSIILETNFRIYAYTSSPLQIAVLNLFTRLKARFPDMVAGRLTRKSMRKAIAEHGITADQIINYLAAHAHEQMHRLAASKNAPVLPPTVVDQIRLWQLENERMRTHSGFLFKDFDSVAEYADIAGFADEIGVLVWRDDKKGMFFASKHEQIRDYLKLRKRAE